MITIDFRQKKPIRSVFRFFKTRTRWLKSASIGKILVSNAIIDRIGAFLGKTVTEVPVGFKWFVDGLLTGAYGFGGEKSAGASFLRNDGTAWATDKDGIIMDLLAAEMLAKTGKDPGEIYGDLENRFGRCFYDRMDAPATLAQKQALNKLSGDPVTAKTLAGETITAALTHAPGNGAAIGELKVVTENGWFAARPSGTEDIYKIYAESFIDTHHLKKIQQEAQAIVSRVRVTGLETVL